MCGLLTEPYLEKFVDDLGPCRHWRVRSHVGGNAVQVDGWGPVDSALGRKGERCRREAPNVRVVEAREECDLVDAELLLDVVCERLGDFRLRDVAHSGVAEEVLVTAEELLNHELRFVLAEFAGGVDRQDRVVRPRVVREVDEVDADAELRRVLREQRRERRPQIEAVRAEWVGVNGDGDLGTVHAPQETGVDLRERSGERREEEKHCLSNRR